MSENEKVIQKIKELRIKAGYNQSFMAQKLRITQSAYGKIEKSRVELTITRLKDISVILGVTIESFFDDANYFNKSMLEKLQKENIGLANSWPEITDKLFIHYIGSENRKYIVTGVGKKTDKHYLIAEQVNPELLERLTN